MKITFNSSIILPDERTEALKTRGSKQSDYLTFRSPDIGLVGRLFDARKPPKEDVVIVFNLQAESHNVQNVESVAKNEPIEEGWTLV